MEMIMYVVGMHAMEYRILQHLNPKTRVVWNM